MLVTVVVLVVEYLCSSVSYLFTSIRVRIFPELIHDDEAIVDKSAVQKSISFLSLL